MNDEDRENAAAQAAIDGIEGVVRSYGLTGSARDLFLWKTLVRLIVGFGLAAKLPREDSVAYVSRSWEKTEDFLSTAKEPAS